MLIMASAVYAAPGNIKCTGQVVDDRNTPLVGVMIAADGVSGTVTTDKDGRFVINVPENSVLYFNSLGMTPVQLTANADLGKIRMSPGSVEDDYFSESSDLIIDDAVFENEEESSQNVAALNGANDDIYYSTASYNFSPMYFRYRGYDSEYQTVYINGLPFNDIIRGRFNFSTMLGMTYLFKRICTYPYGAFFA